MKRHATFVPLSREHHDGLLLATRLKQGGAALLRLWSHDPNWQAETVVRYFDDSLEAHFRVEEELLFPLAAALSGEGPALAERLVREHAELRDVVETFRRPQSQGGIREDLVRFGTLLEAHIRCEERELFPLLEELLRAEELESLGKRLRQFGGGRN
jgi:hemerythrin-like domain-containing protein